MPAWIPSLFMGFTCIISPGHLFGIRVGYQYNINGQSQSLLKTITSILFDFVIENGRFFCHGIFTMHALLPVNLPAIHLAPRDQQGTVRQGNNNK